MTDWLDWLLEELEEDEDQGEDLELRTHVLPRSEGEETGAAGGGPGEKERRTGGGRRAPACGPAAERDPPGPGSPAGWGRSALADRHPSGDRRGADGGR